MDIEYEDCVACEVPVKTVDDCYNQVIQKLTEQGKIQQVSSHLMRLTKDHERVLYVYSVLKELKLFPVVRLNDKSNNVSQYYRNLGNIYFNNKRNPEAYQAYNLSLLYANTSSENFIYAVSNRSAVFFAMKKYNECLEDIKFVFSTVFPEKLKTKLIDRRAQCLAKLAEQSKEEDDYSSKIDELLKINGPRNEKYPCASSKLLVVYTKEMGRHVIAKEDIKPGEILAVEDAYLTVLLEPQYLFSCAYCLSRSMNLYPCLSCVYELYCSMECRDEAIKKYHDVECRLLPTILSMQFSNMDLLALRAVLRSRSDVGNWEETIHVGNIADSRTETDIWGCVKVDEKWIYDSKYYPSIHTLSTNIEKRTLSDIFRKSFEAAVLTHFLSVIRYLGDKEDLMYHEVYKYISRTLFRHIMTSPTNFHSISANIANEYGKYVDEYPIASGAYAFLSLLNHSCAPNVVRYSKLGSSQKCLVAIRPIKQGKQVFDNYGFHHAVQDLKTRQSDLKFQYKFSCICEACLNDWPLHAKLNEVRQVPPQILKKKQECVSSKIIDKLMNGDKKTACDYYQPLCDLIEYYDTFAPCKELAECQEAMKQCLAIFHGVVPNFCGDLLKFKAIPPCRAIGRRSHDIQYISGPSIF